METLKQLPVRGWVLRALSVAFALSVRAHSAVGTVVLPVSPGDVFRQAEAVIVGQVVESSSERTAVGHIRTLWRVDVLQHLAGSSTERSIELRTLGGSVGDETETVPGEALLAPGETYVFALQRASSGLWRTVQLGAGVFRIQQTAATMRRFPASTVVHVFVPAAVDSAKGMWSWEELVETLRVARSDLAELSPPSMATSPSARFQLARPLARWFEADVGRELAAFLDGRGDATLGFEASRHAAANALAAWSLREGSRLRLVLGGSADTLDTPCPAPDGQSFKILFDDPHGQIDPPISCRGTLALTSYRASQSETKSFFGLTFSRTRCATITVADGWELCPGWTPCNLAEILAHEVGHAIGLAHSSEREPEPNDRLRLATMYVRAHFDGRCASLMDDDLDGLRFLYPDAVPPSLVGDEILPPAEVGVWYEYRFPVVGGSPPYDWTITRSDYCGLELTEEGSLRGVPAACRCPSRPLPPDPTPAPTPYFFVRVEDQDRRSHTRFFHLPVQSNGEPVSYVACSPTPTPSPSPTGTEPAPPSATASPTPSFTPSPSSTPGEGATAAPTVAASPTPTNTAGAIATGTASATPSAVTSTPTAPPSTASPTWTPPQTCVGDCDGSGSVTIDELVRLVNIALGHDTVSACPSGDRNRDGQITVEEIVAAVSFALLGC